jgi:hypothetical protein
LVKKKLDFFVLTEARVDVRAVQKLKLRRDLHVTMHSLHQRPRGGVIVFSKKMHKLIPDSVRLSQAPGHFAVGVYEVGTHRIIIAGVYGCSEGDRPSLAIINDLRDRVAELSHVYRTHSIVLTGDFNATLTVTDSNNLTITKPNTVQALLTLMEDHHLVDLGAQTGCLDHTWHRKDSSGHSSRLDLILTNIPMKKGLCTLQQTIFDHAFLHGTMNFEKKQTTHAMKDFILGSEEFLIRSQEMVETLFQQLGKLINPEQEGVVTQGDGRDEGVTSPDDLYTFDDPHSGQTTIQVLSNLIQNLAQVHDDIARRKALEVSKTLRETSATLFSLQKKIKGEGDPGRRQEMHEEIVRLQQNLKTDLEAKDTASRLRIKDFYKTRIGKMQPETFHCIKGHTHIAS